MSAADNEIDYVQWDDHRVGLNYARYNDIVYYYPNAPFYVDGIRYHQSIGGPLCKRTMIEVFEDGGGDSEMRTSAPPTDAELDHYVNTGVISWGRRAT